MRIDKFQISAFPIGPNNLNQSNSTASFLINSCHTAVKSEEMMYMYIIHTHISVPQDE